MNKYEILDKIGEGSFGQVFKAKEISSGKIVAHKVISKLGRSPKELHSLRQEYTIQCHLNHTNIIQMIDSFETKDKIIIVTEFAEKELYEVLGKVKDGRLSEEITRVIAHDLISALGYLHSNLVLHRDLKPQNVLLEATGKVKLCDFGFARSMNSGSHMLMSIKGTPLYMAPELIKGHPYDYNADLWSLGCIIYELIVGHPPFKTTCILDLDRLIKTEAIKWPQYSSEKCLSFLQGLLQKDPCQRLTWPDLYNHPFIQLGESNLNKRNIITSNVQTDKSSDTEIQKILDLLMQRAFTVAIKAEEKKDENAKAQVDVKKLSNELEKGLKLDFKQMELLPKMLPPNNDADRSRLSLDYEREFGNHNNSDKRLPNWELHALKQPIENEEWVAFLQRSMEEIMNGEVDTLLQQNCISVFVSPLRNPAAGCKVLDYVARLFSLPFVVPACGDKLEKIKRVYLEVKVVPNLVYAIKILTNPDTDDSHRDAGNITSGRSTSDLSLGELQALESIIVLLCRLVYTEERYLTQLYDAINIVNVTGDLQQLFALETRKPRVVSDLIAILNHVLRSQPENADLVERVVLQSKFGAVEILTKLLNHRQSIIKRRSCTLIRLLGRFNNEMLKQVWCKQLQIYLEELLSDKDDSVRDVAENAISELKHLPFYHQ